VNTTDRRGENASREAKGSVCRHWTSGVPLASFRPQWLHIACAQLRRSTAEPHRGLSSMFRFAIRRMGGLGMPFLVSRCDSHRDTPPAFTRTYFFCIIALFTHSRSAARTRPENVSHVESVG
jgi:hypothetical protein